MYFALIPVPSPGGRRVNLITSVFVYFFHLYLLYLFSFFPSPALVGFFLNSRAKFILVFLLIFCPHPRPFSRREKSVFFPCVIVYVCNFFIISIPSFSTIPQKTNVLLTCPQLFYNFFPSPALVGEGSGVRALTKLAKSSKTLFIFRSTCSFLIL